MDNADLKMKKEASKVSTVQTDESETEAQVFHFMPEAIDEFVGLNSQLKKVFPQHFQKENEVLKSLV